jgi:predicted transcriptional regulator
MISKRRTDDQIASEILKICVKGASKTRIIYQANLNYNITKSYLNNLTRNGLIDAVSNGPRTVYKTTPKGLELKGRFEQVHTELDGLYA